MPPVPVITNPKLQVTNGGILLIGPGSVPGIAFPTVPGGGNPTTPSLTQGQWIIDPTNEYVLILVPPKLPQTPPGLSLYQVVGAGNPASGQFNGSLEWGPNGGENGFVFCAQSDGNAVVYDNQFPGVLNHTWAGNKGGSNAQYLWVGENGSWAVVQSNPTYNSQ